MCFVLLLQKHWIIKPITGYVAGYISDYSLIDLGYALSGLLFLLTVVLGTLLWLKNRKIRDLNRTIEKATEAAAENERQYKEEFRNKSRIQKQFQKMVSELSAEFITVSTENFDHKIDILLERCGTILGVDRTFLFQFSEDEKLMTNTHE